jgi:hypothetical protein
MKYKYEIFIQIFPGNIWYENSTCTMSGGTVHVNQITHI